MEESDQQSHTEGEIQRSSGFPGPDQITCRGRKLLFALAGEAELVNSITNNMSTSNLSASTCSARHLYLDDQWGSSRGIPQDPGQVKANIFIKLLQKVQNESNSTW